MSTPPDDPLEQQRRVDQRKAIRSRFNAKRGPEGALAATMRNATKLRDEMKAQGVSQGVSQAEMDAALEQTLRLAWPFSREWHYLCDECHDTGLIMLRCTARHRCDGISTRSDQAGQPPGKYQRLCAMHPEHEYEHDYGIACSCPKGERFRKQTQTVEDELTQVGKVSKPTRWGR